MSKVAFMIISANKFLDVGDTYTQNQLFQATKMNSYAFKFIFIYRIIMYFDQNIKNIIVGFTSMWINSPRNCHFHYQNVWC